MITKINIKDIIVGSRFRTNLGDLSDLKESIDQQGLLQPIGIHQGEDGLYTLVWGGRRLAAAAELGWERIEARILENEQDYSLREKELEENIRRKDMTWQEQVCSISEIHRLKTMVNAKIGEKWGYRDTGRLLGISLGNVQYTLEVGKYLRSGDREIKDASSMTEAIRILMKRKENELTAKKMVKPVKDEDAYFSADTLNSLKQTELPVSSPNTKLVINVYSPQLFDKILQQTDFHISTSLAYQDSDEGMEHLLIMVESHPSLVVDQSVYPHVLSYVESSIKPGESLFKNNVRYFNFKIGANFKSKTTGLDNFYIGNGAVDIMQYGPTATDYKFLSSLLEKFFGADRKHIMFGGVKDIGMIVTAVTKGHRVYIPEYIATEYNDQLTSALKFYGTPVFEDCV